MVQGAVKKSKGGKSQSKNKNPILAPKKGARTIAPKKASAIKRQKLTKKHSAGLLDKLERSLADKAGHTELLANGKKKESANAAKKDKQKIKSSDR